jgi:type II secretory pathway component PulF
LAALGLALAAVTLSSVLTLLFTTAVLPVFEALFDDFGMRLPWLTRVTLAVGPAARRGWPLAVAAMVLGGLGWWFLVRQAPRRASAAADFTRALARLVAGGVAYDDAIVLAARVADAPPVDPADPARPLTYAAVAALDAPPAAAAVLLDAVADCHDDRARAGSSIGEWFIGPLAVATIGVLVGLAVIALFLPLVQVVSNLS